MSSFPFVEGRANCSENFDFEIMLKISIHVQVTDEKDIFWLDKCPWNYLHLG